MRAATDDKMIVPSISNCTIKREIGINIINNTEPSEIYFDIPATPNANTEMTGTIQGANANPIQNIEPMQVAIPFPPLNFK